MLREGRAAVLEDPGGGGGRIRVRLDRIRLADGRLQLEGAAHRAGARLTAVRVLFNGVRPAQRIAAAVPSTPRRADSADPCAAFAGFAGYSDAPEHAAKAELVLEFADGARAEALIAIKADDGRASSAPLAAAAADAIRRALGRARSDAPRVAIVEETAGRRAAETRFAIEEFKLRDGKVLLRGWAFRPGARLARAMLETSQHCAALKIDEPRPQVSKVFNEYAARNCGFAGEVSTAAPAVSLSLQFADGGRLLLAIDAPVMKADACAPRPQAAKDLRREALPAPARAASAQEGRRILSQPAPPDAAPRGDVIPLAASARAETLASPAAPDAPERLELRHIELDERNRLVDAGAKTADVILYVDGALEDAAAAIDRLEKTTTAPHRLTIIDDASIDPCVGPYLIDRFRNNDHVRIVSFPKKVGRAAAIDCVAEQLDCDFAVIDYRIRTPRDWLQRLMRPIFVEGADTATPIANAASHLLFPYENSSVDAGAFANADLIDRILRSLPRAPASIGAGGGGLCFGVSLGAWRRLGGFSSEQIKPGMTPEAAFCECASATGGVNAAAADLYVEFDTQMRVGEDGPPRFRPQPVSDDDVAEAYSTSDPISFTRKCAVLQLAIQSAKAPVLVIDGGADRTIAAYREQLLRSYAENGAPAIMIGPAKSGFRLSLQHRGVFAQFAEAAPEAVMHIVSQGRAERLHVISTSGFADMEGLLKLLEAAARRDQHMSFAFADYAPLCPTRNLIDDRGKFCELPDEKACRKCLAHNPRSNGVRDIRAWRARWRPVLDGSEEVVHFSKSSVLRAAQIFDVDRARTRYFEPDAIEGYAQLADLPYEAPPHIAISGDFAHAGARGFVEDMLRALREFEPGASATLFGCANSVFAAAIGAEQAGEREKCVAAFRELGVNIALHVNLWPEPTPAAVSGLIIEGAPVVCLEFGAPGEYVRHYPFGATIREPVGAEGAKAIFTLRNKLRNYLSAAPRRKAS
ncbi:MAG: hypothetical protein Tsb0010_00040 [Parvularculaceae bacterium]